MNMQQIRGIARDHGLKPSRLGKLDLIHAIQEAEGNFACYATATDGYCDRLDCRWRDDCFRAAKKLQQ